MQVIFTYTDPKKIPAFINGGCRWRFEITEKGKLLHSGSYEMFHDCANAAEEIIENMEEE